MTNEFTLCATCGHAGNGHEHPSMAKDPARLKCHHEDGCRAFVPSNERLPDERTSTGPNNPYQPNFWETDNHFGGDQ